MDVDDRSVSIRRAVADDCVLRAQVRKLEGAFPSPCRRGKDGSGSIRFHKTSGSKGALMDAHTNTRQGACRGTLDQ